MYNVFVLLSYLEKCSFIALFKACFAKASFSNSSYSEDAILCYISFEKCDLDNGYSSCIESLESTEAYSNQMSYMNNEYITGNYVISKEIIFLSYGAPFRH